MSSSESSSGVFSTTSPVSVVSNDCEEMFVSSSNKTPNFREWSPLSNLLAKIPLKAQKNYATMDLSFTCIAVDSKFLAIGTNVGLLYWYDREHDLLERLKIEVTKRF